MASVSSATVEFNADIQHTDWLFSIIPKTALECGKRQPSYEKCQSRFLARPDGPNKLAGCREMTPTLSIHRHAVKPLLSGGTVGVRQGDGHAGSGDETA